PCCSASASVDGAGRRRSSGSTSRRGRPRPRGDEPMLVAQITDLHLGFDPGNPDELNRQRLDRTLRRLATMEPRPDLLLVTGDIADNGDDEESYQRFKEAIKDLPFPVYPAMGNHDSRGPFLALFPEVPAPDGFLQ